MPKRKDENDIPISCSQCKGDLFAQHVHWLKVFCSQDVPLDTHLKSQGKKEDQINSILAWAHTTVSLYRRHEGSLPIWKAYVLAHLEKHERELREAETRGPNWYDVVDREREAVERISQLVENA